MQQDQLEPIAVVGIGLRFPGEADNVDGFWDMISNARTAWTEVPKSRFEIDSFYHPSVERQGSVITRGAHFLREDPALFDAPFFSMTSTEAAGTDPQQRWLLEVTYEAFENAGISTKSVVGSETACYIGCFNKDYEFTSGSNINFTSTYAATGNGLSMLANRLSWFYDLRGPSMAIVGGTNMMLEAGPFRSLSTLRFLSPDGKSHSFDAKANGYGRGEGLAIVVLKPLSQALADGDTIRSVIRGTGINQDGKTPGITVPSSDAQRDLILSTYAAAGLGLGETNYFEAHGTGTPIGDPLELSAAGAAMKASRPENSPMLIGSVKPNVGHLEGCAGLAGVIKSILSMEKGLIPAVADFETLNPRLKLEDWGLTIPQKLTEWPPGLRRVSVNSFGYGGSNAHAILDDAYHYLKERNLEGNHITVVNPAPKIIATDSEKPDDDENGNVYTVPKSSERPRLFCLSSPIQGGAARISEKYQNYLQNKLPTTASMPYEQEFLRDLSHTLNNRRTVFDWRSFAVAGTVSSLLERLKNGLPRLPRAQKDPSTAFVFTGQGAQWFSMGRELQEHPVFKDSLQEADAFLSSIGCEWSIFTELNRSEAESRVNLPEFSQPLCTVLQVALVKVLSHWGMRPKAVVGHSSGEIAAAYAAGILTQEDTWRTAYFRGVFSASITTLHKHLRGNMCAVSLSEVAVVEYLKDTEGGEVCVACINSPSSVTISGDISALDEVEKRLEKYNVWFRRLKVGVAYHSHHMSAVADDYLKSISNIKPLDKPLEGVTMFSSVTGSQVTKPTDLDAKYWVANMLSPVRFSAAVINLLKPTDAKSKRRRIPNVQSLVEIGPHSALQGPLNQILMASPEGYDKTVTYTSALRRGYNALETALEVAGKLWSLGHDLNLQLVNTFNGSPQEAVTLVELPSYPWNHDQRYWFESNGQGTGKYEARPRTDLLGLRSQEFNQLEPRWYNFLKPTEIPWVLDHKVQGAILLPGSAMLSMAIEAAVQMADTHKTVQSYELKDVRFFRAIIFQTSDEAVHTSFQMRPYKTSSTGTASTWNQFTLFSVNLGSYVEHCTGLIRTNYVAPPSAVEKGLEAEIEWDLRQKQYAAAKQGADEEINTRVLYDVLRKSGFEFGPTFQNLCTMHGGDNEGWTTFTIPNTKEIMPENQETDLPLHPCTLDAAMQCMIASVVKGEGDLSKLPSEFEHLVISASIPKTPGTTFTSYSLSSVQKDGEATGSVFVSDENFSEPFIVMRGFKSRGSGNGANDGEADNLPRRVCTLLKWVEDFEALTQDSAQSLHTEIEDRSIISTQSADNASVDDDIPAGFLNSLIPAWFNLASYKYPGLKVLEIGNGSVSTTKSILEKLSGSDDGLPNRVSKYTYTESHQDVLARAKKDLEDFAVVDFSTLNPQTDVIAQGFQDGQYDVVIYTGPLQEPTVIGAMLKSAKTLLRKNGTLVAGILTNSPERVHILDTEPKFGPSSSQDWHELLRSHNFTGTDATFYHSTGTSIIISTSDSPTSFNFKDVVFLTPKEASKPVQALISNLSQLLNFRSLKTSECSLESISAIKDTVFVSFAELGGSILEEMSEREYDRLKELLTTSAGVLSITDSGIKAGLSTPAAGLSIGLFRTVRSEAPHLRLVNFDLSHTLNLSSPTASRLIMHVFDKTFAEELVEKDHRDNEFAEEDGRLYVPRLVLENEINVDMAELNASPRPHDDRLMQTCRPLKMEIAKPGLLDTFRFTDQLIFEEPPPTKKYVTIRVKAAGVNLLDLMTALGKVPSKKTGFGSEVVGVIEKVDTEVNPKFKVGDVVVAVVEEGFATHVRIGDDALQHLPEGMNEVDAVGCVVPYVTAYCSLIDLARLSHGESVLIHAAAGGVGQAAIQLAKWVGAEIYATVGSLKKKTFLMEHYGIPEDHIFNSRDLTFAAGISRMTNGAGVDVVLNSTPGDALAESWNCVADFGRFVEIGKRDIIENNGLEMKHFLRNCQFIGFNLQQMDPGGKFSYKATDAHAKVFDLIRKGAIKPLYPVTVYPFSQFEQAFRALQSGTVIGKIVMQANDEDIVPVMPRAVVSQPLNDSSTYVLVGGLGGIGRALASYMVTKGARHLAFLSRSGASSDEAKDFLASLEKQEINVTALACDVSDKKALNDALQALSQSMPKIKGVIQCAMVLRDGIFDKMTYDDWKTTTLAKVQGSWNLHELFPRDMDFFVLLASASGVIGNPGQANYAAGCVYQDQLATFRRRQGLAATAIDLGAVTGVGYLAENTDQYQGSEHLDAMSINEQELYVILTAAINGRSDRQKKSETPAQVTTGIPMGEVLRNLMKKFEWSRDPKLSILRRMDGQGEALKEVDGTRAALREATNAAEAAGIIEDALVGRLAKALAISIEDINTAQPLHSYGVDSLVAVEVRNWLIRELQADISVFDILGTMPISALAVKILETSKLLASKFDGENKGAELAVEKEAPEETAVVSTSFDAVEIKNEIIEELSGSDSGSSTHTLVEVPGPKIVSTDELERGILDMTIAIVA